MLSWMLYPVFKGSTGIKYFQEMIRIKKLSCILWNCLASTQIAKSWLQEPEKKTIEIILQENNKTNSKSDGVLLLDKI